MSETSSTNRADLKGRKDPEVTHLREASSLGDDTDKTPGDQTRVLGQHATRDLGEDPGSESQLTEEPLREQIDRYRVIELLGAGGFGSVYLAHDDVLRRNVSIKLPHRCRVSTAAQLQRYMNEAMMVAQLDHPKIVPVFDVGQLPDGLCYVVSKYIECETLSDLIKRPMTARKAIEIAIDLAETLQHVHEAGIVHRDMKPANVLVSREGTYFINDFGLAMIEVSEADQGVMIGTPAYMSPEQAFGEGHLVDGRSDIFSLGVMLYEMLVGRRPFRGGSTEQVLYQIREREPKPMRQLNRALPVALERVCQKALAKQTGYRYSSAIDFANDLRQVLEQWDGLETGTVEFSDSVSRSSTSGIASNSVSGMSAPTVSGDDVRVAVIPKGLRSYDQHDAAFFKAMLPGPYDLDGCPESIRFWKNRIDPARGAGPIGANGHEVGGRGIEPFRVGVIYGTSGCGKSSFIRAGLIPMLDETVRVCIVDATTTGTLERLDQALSQRVPTFEEIPRLRGDSDNGMTVDYVADPLADVERRPRRESDSALDDQSSAQALGNQDRPAVPIDKRMASIRRGENLPAGDKVLIVIDQFEQWLNSADAAERALFIRAMRQCDGQRLQAIFLVRDDFWLATSRLMRELDIELSASTNLAMIDLLDKQHSRKLLRLFGRAYGRIGEDGTRLHREQRQFISDAVDGLASGERVIAVQLSLFAEMMKTRSWTRATLRGLSGIDRVVEQFLHESFDASSAPKNQRIHREAAHKLLGAMLPETGLIRAGSIQLDVLTEAAGYGNDSHAMGDLIRVLDNKLKLITPVESGPATATGVKSDSSGSPIQPRYQLTHDSLIPAVRRWLTKHEAGSITGRAKRDLKTRSQAWAESHDSRQLPSVSQWLRFSALTRSGKRSEDERAMMSIAKRRYGSAFAALAVALIAFAFVGRHLLRDSRAESLANQASTARSAQLPRIFDEIDADPKLVTPKLKAILGDPLQTERARFRVALALPEGESIPTEIVTDYILEARLDEIELWKQRRSMWLDEHRAGLEDLLNDVPAQSEQRFRAALLLVESGDSEADGAVAGIYSADAVSPIEANTPFIAEAVVEESLSNKLAYANLVSLTKPVRRLLTPEFVSVVNGAQSEASREAAFTLIRDLNAEHPIDLLDAALELEDVKFDTILKEINFRTLTMQQLEPLLKAPVPVRENAGRRVGRTISIASIISTTGSEALSGEVYDWSEQVTRLSRSDPDSVSMATMLHCLTRHRFEVEQLFDASFDSGVVMRATQLFAMGEALRNQDDWDEDRLNRAKSLGRERFRSAEDPGVFSAARWLLVRLGDQDWLDEQMEKRIEPVGPPSSQVKSDELASVSDRIRINILKMSMIRFVAGSIASHTDVAPVGSTDPLQYDFEIASNETSVKAFKEIIPSYYHEGELQLSDPRGPVGVVTWDEAVEFCKLLTIRAGMTEEDQAYRVDESGRNVLREDYRQRGGYRLPTAREWMAVWNADPARTACVFDDSLVEFYARILPHSKDRPEILGGVKPDRNGMFHLAGNCEEWCSDQFREDRSLCGIFYGWELEDRHQILKPKWRNSQTNYLRLGFRIVRSVPRRK